MSTCQLTGRSRAITTALLVLVSTVGSVSVGTSPVGAELAPLADATTAAAVASTGFVPRTPIRMIDTRVGLGGTLGPLDPDSVLRVQLPNGVPTGARSVALTVTADQYAELGFVTAYPCNSPRPLASLLNPLPGEPRSNQLVANVDGSRAICLYTRGKAELIVDMTGWFIEGGATFHPLTPTRVLDSRFGPRPDGGSGRLRAGELVSIPIAGRNGVPVSATAVTANVTVTNSEGDGYVTAFPCGTPVPPTSTGNVPNGGTRASFALVGLGNRNLCVYVKRAGDLVVDLTGWFGPGAGNEVIPATPRRLLDTRIDSGGPLDPARQRVLRLGLPAGTTSAAVNVTAVDAEEPGWISILPCSQSSLTSTVNFDADMAIANLVTVPVAGSDSLCIRTNVTSHVVIDLAAASKLGPVARLDVAGLRPSFRPDIVDYVVPCAAGENLIGVHAAAERGATVQIDALAPAGSFTGDQSLQPGEAFTATFADLNGSTTYRVRCLPPDFPAYTAYRPGASTVAYLAMTPGTAVGQSGAYAVVVDREGVPVWWYKNPTQVADAKLTDGPNLAWASAAGTFGSDPTSEYTFHALDGSVTGHAKVVGSNTDFHDMAMLPNGNRVVMSYPVRDHVNLTALGMGDDRLVLDGLLQELTPSGTVVWEWRSQDHIAPGETTRPSITRLPDNRLAVDLIHLNSIEPDGDGLVVSARHLDAVFRIDRMTGKVLWKLGGTPTNEPGAKNLAFVGDPSASLGAQHDARILADGTLTIYDNRTNVGAPRAVRYRLDVAAGTATLLEQVRNPAVTASGFQGSARRTSTGSWVISWGASRLNEELSATGDQLFSFTWDSVLTYRAAPIESGELSREALAAGMDAQFPHT